MKATFASDNVSAVSPEILDALTRLNSGSAISYGEDDTTAELNAVMKGHFGSQAETFPVFTGTAANVISLQALLPRWGAALCTESAHIGTAEGGAPEKTGGLTLIRHPGREGKLRPEDLDSSAADLGNVHAPQPLAVSITQSTENGTVYSLTEIRRLADTAHAHGMALHCDGARLSNAAVALDCSLRELVTDTGIDVLSLGATKNGAMGAEAVVVINPERVAGVANIRKYCMHLASKQRFISAQLLELYGTELWRDNARHANTMAKLLAEQLDAVAGVWPLRQPAVNSVLLECEPRKAEAIREEFLCHYWGAAESGRPVLRVMCSFATTEEDISEFVARATAV